MRNRKTIGKIIEKTGKIESEQAMNRKLVSMAKKDVKVNNSYMGVYKEIPLLIKAELIRESEKECVEKGKVLIVNTCLIGDFIASTPALCKFIRKHYKQVDIIVSRPLKPIAERIRGIRKVFIAKSVYDRDIEKDSGTDATTSDDLDCYDKVIVMRISKESYNLIKHVQTNEIKTSLVHHTTYGAHLLGKNIMKKTPKQWRDMNFEILGEKNTIVTFDDIFEFTKEDYEKIENIPEIQRNEKDEKLVIVHTRASFIMQQWDLKNWVALLKRLHASGKYRFIFVGATKEQSDYEKITKKLDFKTYSLINKVDLKDLLLIMRRCDYFVGIDSGPRNMAHIADLRSVTLLGPAPHLFMPPCKKDIAIDKSNGRGLYQKFFYKKNGFIHQITVDEVYDAFQKIVRNSNKGSSMKK
jgi:ADP-heptose:LPS heptosyltransferase